MYPVSADFHNLSIADAPTSRVRIYFIEANVDCTDDNDVQTNGTLLCMPGETDSNGRIEKGGVTINEFFNSDTNVQIGATVSSQIGMTLINRDGALDGFNYGRCKVYIDVYDDTNSTWLTCPMGVYNIAIPKRRKVQLVSATGYDQMQQLDEIADSWWNGLDWSNGITVLQIIQSMAATLGIHLSANTSANIVNSGLSYTEIPFTAIEMTYRDILSYIAETTGTIARFDRNGALDLRWFSDAVLSTDTQTYAGGLVTFTATDRASISSLSVPFSPIQDLHGYANPWPAGGGKNLLNIAPQSGTVAGVSYTVDADGYIVLNGTAGNGCNIYLAQHISPINSQVTLSSDTNIPVGVYTGLVLQSGNTGVLEIASGVRIRTSGVDGVTVETRYRIYIVSGVVLNNYKCRIMLNYGTSALEWSPYSNICPISGRTGVSVYDDPKYGGTVAWNQLVENGNFASTTGWNANYSAYCSFSISDNVASITRKDLDSTNDYSYSIKRNLALPAGHKYFITGEFKIKYAHQVGFYLVRDSFKYPDGNNIKLYRDTPANTWTRISIVVGFSEHPQAILQVQLDQRAQYGYAEGDIDYVRNINVFDLTQMFGSTIADYIYGLEQNTAGAGVAYFRNLFPKDYYPYNAGEQTCVSAVNGDTYWKKDIDWTTQAGTVYGGTLDVVTGVLTVDWAIQNLWEMGWLYLSNVGVFYTSNSLPAKFAPCLSNIYAYSNISVGSGRPDMTINVSLLYFGVNKVSVKDSRYTSTSDFRQMLEDNGAQVVYKLATPLTYQLTPTQVAVLAGTNNVWSTGDSVSVTVAEPNLVEIQTDTVGNQCLSIDVGEYQVSQIDALSVKASQADVGVTIGSGGNAYTILDNPMLFGDEAAITTKATPIYNRLSAFRLFTPISMRCIMDWSIEAGDIITVTNESVTYDMPIFQQRLRWRGGYVVSDLFSSGEQERPTQSKEIRSSFRSNTQMHEFEVTLEQLRSYIQSVDGNYTLIQQTVDAIAQTVSNQNVTIQNILDPTGEIWTAITKNTSNLSSIEDSLNNEITERRSYIRFIPSEPAIVMGVDEDNEIKLKLVNNIIYFFNGADDSTDLSLAYAYFNSQEAFADRFVAGESVQIGTSDNAAHWLWKKLNNGDLVLELVG